MMYRVFSACLAGLRLFLCYVDADSPHTQPSKYLILSNVGGVMCSRGLKHQRVQAKMCSWYSCDETFALALALALYRRAVYSCGALFMFILYDAVHLLNTGSRGVRLTTLPYAHALISLPA